ncbi:MAG: 5'/3'-nucleotidase SurE [Clostridia bacterium]|nr:5'/3'-nucleotidase SurE [Clostridia bacterium]
MRILLVNDDGIFAPGINALASALKAEHEIIMVAPEKERSGFSQSLTYLSPIKVRRVTVAEHPDIPAFAVSGTPADCAKFGIKEAAKNGVDLVISGINNGFNIGTDIYYSGTIGGATEAAMLGVPAIAVSEGRSVNMDYAFSAEYTAGFLKTFDLKTMPERTILNINLPRDPKSGIKGVKLTRQGILEYHEYYEVVSDDGEEITYRLKGDLESSVEEDTDHYALENRYISISALKYDRTDTGFSDTLGKMI